MKHYIKQNAINVKQKNHKHKCVMNKYTGVMESINYLINFKKSIFASFLWNISSENNSTYIEYDIKTKETCI